MSGEVNFKLDGLIVVHLIDDLFGSPRELDFSVVVLQEETHQSNKALIGSLIYSTHRWQLGANNHIRHHNNIPSDLVLSRLKLTHTNHLISIGLILERLWTRRLRRRLIAPKRTELAVDKVGYAKYPRDQHTNLCHFNYFYIMNKLNIYMFFFFVNTI